MGIHRGEDRLRGNGVYNKRLVEGEKIELGKDLDLDLTMTMEHILQQSSGGGNVRRVRMESLKLKLKVATSRIDRWMDGNRLKWALEVRRSSL